MKYKSVWEASAALSRGEVTSTVLTEELLEQIHASPFGAYLTVCDDVALAAAKRADKLRWSNPTGVHPLCGIPYSLKDNFVTVGVQTTCASRILAGFVPQYDSTVNEKLRNCGAVLVGKTDMDEFAMGSAGHYSAYGRCVNPLDPTKSAGGSSTGAAASVAAGEAYFALGSDTGGSARQPASFCGLVAMKPTYGLVSRFGLVEFASSMDTICPITRTVADNRLVLSAIAGPDIRDMTTITADLYEERCTDSLEGLRVGVMAGYEVLCDTATAHATERMVTILMEAGAHVTTVQMPSPEIAVDVYVTTAAAEACSNLARYDGIRYGVGAEGANFADVVTNARTMGLGAEVKRRILAGKFALSSVLNGDYYRRVSAVRAKIGREIGEILQKVDVILLPTTATVAFPAVLQGVDPDVLYESDAFTVYANLTGLPALQIPSGGDGTLPCGISFLGGRCQESVLYTIASYCERMIERYRVEWRCL